MIQFSSAHQLTLTRLHILLNLFGAISHNPFTLNHKDLEW